MGGKKKDIPAKAKGKASKVKKAAKFQGVRNAISYLKGTQGQKLIGLSLIFIGLFLLLAFISSFFTGSADQTVVEEGLLGNPRNELPSNWLGSIGASLAAFFIRGGFGWVSLLIPIFILLWGLSYLEDELKPIVQKVLFHLIFTVITISLISSFLGYLFTGEPKFAGGQFGNFINGGLFNFIGKIGAGIFILLLTAIYGVVGFNADFKWVKWIRAQLFNTPDPQILNEEIAEEKEQLPASESPKNELENEKNLEKGKTKGLEFEVSVKKVDENGNLIEVIVDSNGKERSTTENTPPKDKEDTTKTENFEDLSLSLEIEDTNKDQLNNLNLEIETTVPEPENTLGLSIEGDNIHEVKKEVFEKIIPEGDKAKLSENADVGDWEEYDPTKDLSRYQFPQIDLLQPYENQNSREINRGELEANKNKIVQTLLDYKIEIKHIKATIGPTVTLYEIVPAAGVRISKIKNLEDDIALSLAALGIRIIAPIPGKGTIGIEIPNSNPEIVAMRNALATEKFRDTKAELPLALGRTISNEIYIADLAKMPHLLIAGATGQGKSVGINGMITSLLYKKHPAQMKFVLIDPKKVELNLYSALKKHFLAQLPDMEEPIITDTKQVIHVLNSLCLEMDNRYELLKAGKVRNLKEYNEKFVSRKLNPKKGHRYLPYIVLIIDEFADLMMTAGKEIEAPIARLAQLARAIGIHLILATQRPSVNVITGLIKANFPARISFRVTSKIDSRTILDTGGADQLIGRGDLLLSTGNEIVRIQNAFIDTPEVDKVVSFISKQQGYPEPYYLPEVVIDENKKEDGNDPLDDLDQHFEDAARLVVGSQMGSTSMIQRRLKLGYNRAGRIIDQLEAAGIVGPFSGSKARQVLIPDEYHLEQILNDLN